MHMISTTKEQSRRLLDCGVDSQSADMVWVWQGRGSEHRLEIRDDSLTYLQDIPAWSLSKLIMMIPKTIVHPDIMLMDEGDSIPPLKEFMWQMEGNDRFKHKDFVSEASVLVSYIAISFFRPDHPIMPNGMELHSLRKADGTPQSWRSSDPIEACVGCIEWLMANGYSLKY